MKAHVYEHADEAWREDARCIGKNPEIFYPAPGHSLAATLRITTICSPCKVRDECLAYALRNGIRHGYWGGMSERERRRLAKNRGRGSGRSASANRNLQSTSDREGSRGSTR